MTRNLLTTLEQIRPDAHIDELWPNHLQVTARDRIMATSTDPVVPVARRRRAGAIAVVAAITAAGGVGVAAATGLMPKAFTDAYSGWLTYPDSSGVNPAAAERIAAIPGPDGTVMSVFVAQGTDGTRCVAPVFESAADTEQAGPANFTKLMNYCRPAVDTGPFGQGAGGEVGTSGSLTYFTYDAAAGEAVRAELHTSSGEVFPTMLVEGRFFGWFPMPDGMPMATLVGYDANGNVIGRTG
ncbi:hypothetical protein [Rhodococcus tukisamuensis]|uniref:Uncharacterized protein n=1 Tax=Rhodococcus tukisamuensis TaxID=168276 RepID=A0A1G6TAX6_9NOCA|nr:hypothetical protein [Rhodococcus tukisamuensis]SDD25706.1 hypothetical protein SAMN05444580_103445 [Rhodococcus tukisamuensis]